MSFLEFSAGKAMLCVKIIKFKCKELSNILSLDVIDHARKAKLKGTILRPPNDEPEFSKNHKDRLNRVRLML